MVDRSMLPPTTGHEIVTFDHMECGYAATARLHIDATHIFCPACGERTMKLFPHINGRGLVCSECRKRAVAHFDGER
jgi:NADH pyrophosphatase NudC (nudix superfamily)